MFPSATGDEDPKDEHQGVRGAGAHVHPPAHRHLPRRVENLPVLQRAHQPGRGRAGATRVCIGAWLFFKY